MKLIPEQLRPDASVGMSVHSHSPTVCVTMSFDSATGNHSMSKMTKHKPTVVRTDRGLSINGTRITLYHVMDYVRAGRSPDEIQDRLRLTDRQIADVMEYIAAHRPEVEAEYEQVLAQAEENRRFWEERNRERLERIASLPPRPELAAFRAKLAARKANNRDS
jgi:uncharacterized protein (DUF433 family)